MIKVKWIDGHRVARSRPNPQYPNGIDVDVSGGAFKTCITLLPYPALRCGFYSIKCDHCGLTGLITTAGRIDDPRSIKLACKLN
jgi:hypothetical protein